MQHVKLGEVRAMRSAAGISLQAIASKSGFATQTVQRFFAGGLVTDRTRDRIVTVVRKALQAKRATIEKLSTSTEVAV